jgi:hypothetical protein
MKAVQLWVSVFILGIVPAGAQQLPPAHPTNVALASVADKTTVEPEKGKEPMELPDERGKGDKDKKPPKKVEVTGQYRLRYESQQNFDLVYGRQHLLPKAGNNDDNFLLSQFRLNLDLRPNKYVQAHFTFQDSREFFSHQIDSDVLDQNFRNTFENKSDLYEAWVKLRMCDAPFWLQIGRQELIYGDKRLLGNSNWRNAGRSFDALRLLYEKGDAKLDLFAANRVLVDSNAWDHADHHDNFLGAYGTVKNLPYGLQDLYLFYRDDNNRRIEEYTLGTRIVGDKGPIDWNLEGAYQWGSSVDAVSPFIDKTLFLDHQAWAVHAEVGYTCKDNPLKPRLAFEYDFASGDKDPLDHEDNTFDQLFPNNHTPFGIMDFVGWKNMEAVGIKSSWQQTKKLKVGVDWFFFWQPEPSTDAWYDTSGRTFRNAAGKPAGSHVGNELNLLATYKLTDKFGIEGGYGHFFSGGLAADTATVGGGADDANFVYVQTTWKF